MTVDDARRIARSAHLGQVDKQGLPYRLHLERVVHRTETVSTDVQIVALLHDVVEDSPITLQALREAGASDLQLSAVDALTRRTGEVYRDYLERLATWPDTEARGIAIRVKLADLDDHLAAQSAIPVSLVQRYTRARQQLTETVSARPDRRRRQGPADPPA